MIMQLYEHILIVKFKRFKHADTSFLWALQTCKSTKINNCLPFDPEQHILSYVAKQACSGTLGFQSQKYWLFTLIIHFAVWISYSQFYK